ncbi:aspartate kinase [Sphingomicrobium astaxanthinifaciens]|uniref:aspartate kinase n=1 Tax=Sphingomicrobium astaxanthinifaciens TaxID=1227949 RepID=UPI001FCB708A|nr:aspartate kinase [Sphingomicrobium astaxanthinifaciens]MCJ7421539.1 aspartate kinase [Sphingomicrobium astaxanthinifaciens]
MKFGGTSMAGIERIRHVARLVERQAASSETCVVVSAMAGETDRLVQFCKEAAAHHDPREYDVVVASGEQVTAGLLAMTLQNAGLEARSFMGWQLLEASGVHGNARVEKIESGALDGALRAGTVAVIPGFQGRTEEGRIATLGRGGSDTSAVAIAAGLRADRCDIYTDVAGVYTTDPRIEPTARKLEAVGAEEMLELAGAGAKVLQVRSVGLAIREDMPLTVRSAFEDEPGTHIITNWEEADMERIAISGIAADRSEALVKLAASDRPGRLAAALRALASEGLSVDMVAQGPDSLHFTVPKTNLARALKALDGAKDAIGQTAVTSDDNVAKVSVVGVGIRSNPELAAKVFDVLADRQVPLLAATLSELKASALVPDEQVDVAVRALHAAFELGE